MIEFIHQLQGALSQPLPGPSAQYKMAHAARKEHPPTPKDVREAGVMALFFPKQEEWNLALIQRNNDNPNDRHGGQISFPGGKREKTDNNLTDTALRETEEEIGVKYTDIKILGGLSELYIPVSNFRVEPYVGYLDYTPIFRPQLSEVQAVIEVPFHLFQDKKTKQYTNLQVTPQIKLNNVPHFNIDSHIVWGATAMMISELLEALK
ncbi:MAG: CoA pyrophosphatase [Bacteroidota bacterium]